MNNETVKKGTAEKSNDVLAVGTSDGLCGDFDLDKTSSGYWRTSCSCGRAVIKQPHMSDEEWNKIRGNFVMIHCGENPT